MTKDLRRKLKELLIERLKFEDMTPDDIPDDEPLFGGGLGLDSIDALEIVVMLETEFGIKVKNETTARDSFKKSSTNWVARAGSRLVNTYSLNSLRWPADQRAIRSRRAAARRRTPRAGFGRSDRD